MKICGPLAIEARHCDLKNTTSVAEHKKKRTRELCSVPASTTSYKTNQSSEIENIIHLCTFATDEVL